MANKPTKPNFPLGLESQEQSIFQEGLLNNGVMEHGPDAVMTVPETVDASGIPSAIRYNATDDQFEGYYADGGWMAMGGGGSGRWELLPHADTTTLQLGRAYLVDNSPGASTVVFPSPKRIGDSITLTDLNGKFSTYPLSVDGGGNAIYGSVEPMTISTDNVSATFTWTGDGRGWVITAGVGLGQGRVYSREIYSQTLSAETVSITLSTQPSIVDVYVNGKRLKESLYTLNGYDVQFDPHLVAGDDVQIIQYIPIQLGNGGNGGGGTVITWIYNGGAANGGETEITLDIVVDSVSEIYIRGSRQQIGLGFEFDPATSKITLADALEQGDDVVVVINGDPTVYNQIDRSPQEVARSNNVPNSEVILSTDKTTVLNGKTILYDVLTQTSWIIPGGIPAGAKIKDVASGTLTYTPGDVSVQMEKVPSTLNIKSKTGWDKIGKVNSFSELRSIVPTHEGQTIILLSYREGWNAMNAPVEGGGQFIAKIGTPSDDGGFICVPTGQTTYYWQRVLETGKLTPSHYGARMNSTRTTPGDDATSALNNMFAKAVENNWAVEFPSGVSGSNAGERAYYVTSAVKATGIHIIHGDVMLHFSSSTFDKTKGAYAIIFGDPFTDRTTIQNGLIANTVTVRDLDRRATEMGGIYLKYTAVFASYFRALDCNGSGIEMAPVYDSCFSVMAERCGNINTYSIYTNGNGDECNTIVFPYILCHDAYHKGIMIAGSKHVVLNVHAEANAVLTTNDGYIGLTGATTSTGLQYVNHVFYIVGGHLGNIGFNDYGNTDGKTYYDDQDTLNASAGSHVAIALVNSTCDNVINEIVSNSGGNIGRISLFTANTNSSIKKISAGHCYFESSARITVDNASINTLYSWSTFTKINGGRVTNWGNRVIAKLSDMLIDASSMTDAQSYVRCTDCTLNNGITRLSSSTLNRFVGCDIHTINSTSVASENGEFINCNIGNTGGVTVSGGSAATPKSFNFRGCDLRGTWTGATAYDSIRFIGTDNVPKQTYNLGNWLWPRHTRPGTLVTQHKSSYLSGDVVQAVCLTVDAQGVNTWANIVIIP